jgi:peroxin-7
MQASATKAQIYLSVTETELLACDWAKYSENIIATAGSDCSVKGWDLRNYSQPLFHVMDHGHAVRRVKFSPYHPTTFASVSYDMSLRY